MYDVIVLFAIVATALAPGRRFAFGLSERVRVVLEKPIVLPLALVAIVLAQHAYLALMVDASLHQLPAMELLRHQPVRIVNDTGGPTHIASSYGERFAALAILESLALAVVYVAMARGQRWQLGAIAATAVLMYVDALFVRAGTSADMYSYVGFTLLGSHAYAPPAIAFPGEFSVINDWWGTPTVPAPYGPLWLALASAVASVAATLFAKIVALRCLGIVALLGVVALLAAMRFPARIVALVALNPALVLEFVANVHNDLFAVALLMGARLAATRGGLAIAILCTIAAALVKIPFVLFAALAFVPIASRQRRIAAYAFALVGALAISWLWGGAPYLTALQHHANEHTASPALGLFSDASGLLKIAAFVGIGAALLANVWVEGIAWTLPALGAAFFPWYLSWTLAYAVASREMLRNVAIALPIVTLVADGALGNGRLIVVVQAAAYCWIVVLVARAVIARRRNAASIALPRATSLPLASVDREREAVLAEKT